MALINSSAGYGALTKLIHWLIVVLFALQYVGGNIMTGIGFDQSFAGLSSAFYYNWHKSLGLVALVVAVVRLLNRQAGRLPPWAATLSARERRLIHLLERLFYIAMLVMPVSGWLYVMWGHYGVNLFGIWEMPRPLPRDDTLRDVAKGVHLVAGWVLLGAIAVHVFVVAGHQIYLRDGLIGRMLPRR